jgi:hypothetical protein
MMDFRDFQTMHECYKDMIRLGVIHLDAKLCPTDVLDWRGKDITEAILSKDVRFTFDRDGVVR